MRKLGGFLFGSLLTNFMLGRVAFTEVLRAFIGGVSVKYPENFQSRTVTKAYPNSVSLFLTKPTNYLKVQNVANVSKHVLLDAVRVLW